jgi:ATP phosphoribosyltransferase
MAAPTRPGRARVSIKRNRNRENCLIMALPNGRILSEVMPLLRQIGVEPEAAFDDPASRQLRFTTSEPGLDLIRIRSFDAATFVAFGAAQLGIAGNDVLMEFDYSEIYAPLDLDVGHCRIAVAATAASPVREDLRRSSHIRVATKYPEITRRHFAARGVQAECIKLNGAIELAPRLGLCHHIVDLVQTGATLKANGLIEIEPIAAVSSRLIVNRPALKTRPEEVGSWIERLREAVAGRTSPTEPFGPDASELGEAPKERIARSGRRY